MTQTAAEIAAVLIWGFAATATLSAVMYGAQRLGYSRLSIPFLVGTLFTGERSSAQALGVVFYLLGGWLFAFIYYFIFAAIGRTGWEIGLLIGAVHGAVLLVMLLPLLPYVHPRMASEYEGPHARAPTAATRVSSASTTATVRRSPPSSRTRSTAWSWARASRSREAAPAASTVARARSSTRAWPATCWWRSTKFGAAAVTSSAAMLSEAVHSAVDTSNELLLLYGERAAQQPPDKRHPFGHGREVYFWSFIVSLLIFVIGAGVSIVEGVRHILAAERIENPVVSYVVLGLAAVFEGGSWWVAWKDFRKRRGDRGVIEAAQETKDPSSVMVFFEDSAALIGIAIALAGTALAQALDEPRWDGAASIAIGVLLALVAGFLARETKQLLIGEGASRALLESVGRIASAGEGGRAFQRHAHRPPRPARGLRRAEPRFRSEAARRGRERRRREPRGAHPQGASRGRDGDGEAAVARRFPRGARSLVRAALRGSRRWHNSHAARCPSGGIGRHKGLEEEFERPGGNARSGTRQIRRTPWTRSEPTPSQARSRTREGVESRRRAPTAFGLRRRRAPGHERRKPAAKAEAARKSLDLGRTGSSPVSGTN